MPPIDFHKGVSLNRNFGAIAQTDKKCFHISGVFHTSKKKTSLFLELDEANDGLPEANGRSLRVNLAGTRRSA
jgi:hypothetical protein